MRNDFTISELTPIDSIASVDLFVVVDTSDHTQSTQGSTKKATAAQVQSYILNNIPWNEITATPTPLTLSANQGYKANGVALINFVLPVSSTFGDQFIIRGFGSGLFQITQNDGQKIIFDTAETTIGAAGRIVSHTPSDGIQFMCMEDNTTFQVVNFIGTFESF